MDVFNPTPIDIMSVMQWLQAQQSGIPFAYQIDRVNSWNSWINPTGRNVDVTPVELIPNNDNDKLKPV